MGDSDAPWFVAADVCRILDLDVASGARGLDADEKGLHSVPTPGGIQRVAVVSESGKYELIFRSRKPAARAFRKWVTSEVLPALRRDGGYVAPGIPAKCDPLTTPCRHRRGMPAVSR